MINTRCVYYSEYFDYFLKKKHCNSNGIILLFSDDIPGTSTATSNVESSPIGGKHHLTPSKQDVLPELKRFNVGRFILSFNNELADSRIIYVYVIHEMNSTITVINKIC